MPEKYSEIAARIWPFILPKVERLTDVAGANGDAGTPGTVSGAPSPHDLNGVHHSGTLANSQGPQFALLDGTRAYTGNITFSGAQTIDGVDLSAHVGDPDAHHARATAGNGLGISGQELSLDTPGTVTASSTNAVTTNSHTHAATATADAHATPGALLKSDGSGYLEVVKLTATTIDADADLTLDPTGNIVLPNAQELRTTSIADLVTGIAGMRMYDRGSNYRQLNISGIKADELYVRVFVADETRIDRGEEYWSKSYGIVEQDFTWPAYGDTVDVWFEDAPGLAAGNLFSVGDWLYGRSIDWSTGMATFKGWGIIDDGGSTGGRVTRDANYRQQWRIRRYSVGESSRVIKKGSLFLDVGQSGQGWVHLSALTQDNGPYIEMGDWSATRGATAPINVPYRPDAWRNEVRMGNLNGAAGYGSNIYGFAAGVDLGVSAGSGFQGVTIEPTNGLRLWNVALQGYNGSSLTSSLTPTGTLKLGTNVAADNTTMFAVFTTAETFGGEAFGAGDVLIGNRDAANALWDASAGQLQFRGVTTVQAYVGADGRVYAGAGAVVLDSSGLNLAYDDTQPAGDQNSIVWYSNPATKSGEGARLSHYVSTIVSHMELHAEHATGVGRIELVAEDHLGTVSLDVHSADGVTIYGAGLTLLNNTALQMQDTSGVARSALYMSTPGNDLILGYGVQSGNYVSLAPEGVTNFLVYANKVAMNQPLLLQGSDTITSAPQTAASNTGWKVGLYSNTWAIGLAPLSLVIRQGANGWLACFNNANPAANATSTAKDGNAYFGVNANYLQYDGAFGEAWIDATYNPASPPAFATYSSSYNAAGYKKCGDMVFLRGVVGTGSGAGTGNRIFTLPAGYFNASTAKIIAVVSSSAGGSQQMSHIEIQTDGDVVFTGDATEWLSLDGVVFSMA